MQAIPVIEDTYCVEQTAEYVSQMARGLDHHQNVLVSRSGCINKLHIVDKIVIVGSVASTKIYLGTDNLLRSNYIV